MYKSSFFLMLVLGIIYFYILNQSIDIVPGYYRHFEIQNNFLFIGLILTSIVLYIGLLVYEHKRKQ